MKLLCKVISDETAENPSAADPKILTDVHSGIVVISALSKAFDPEKVVIDRLDPADEDRLPIGKNAQPRTHER